MYLLIKTIISAVLVVIISEVARRNTAAAAILASLPVISILAFVWLYTDTKNVQKVADLAISVRWMIIPSLVLFFVLPALLKKGMQFHWALSISMVLTTITYLGFIAFLDKTGIRF